MKTTTIACAYCGAASLITRDHIPPKGIFPAPRPNDLITVPACASCNRAASESDELFRAYLSLHVGFDTPSTRRLWEQRALPRIRRRPRLRDHIVRKSERVWLTTPGGVIHGHAYRMLWDSNVHDKTIERLIRGLYFHHYQEVLGRRVHVKTHWYRGLTEDLLDATSDCEQRSVGNGQFAYRFGRAVDGQLHSIWLFEFHGRHWAGGETAPVDDAAKDTFDG
jgi:hypothetical protein